MMNFKGVLFAGLGGGCIAAGGLVFFDWSVSTWQFWAFICPLTFVWGWYANQVMDD